MRTKGYAGAAGVLPQFGVDPDLARTATLRRSAGHRIVAGLVEEKGIFVLLAALAGLDIAWRLHVMGTGPLEAKARRRAAQLGLDDRISWARGVASTLVPDRLRTFSVLVQPSLTPAHWKEQFGRAVMEAMACGVAVVGSASAEIPNVIGDAGLLVPEGDAAALRDVTASIAHGDRGAPRRQSL